MARNLENFMPHYSYDGEFTSETDFDDPSQYSRDENGDFSGYYPANAQFEASQLPTRTRQILGVLTEMGATHVHCSYNGGFDEGFAFFEALTINGEKVEKTAVIERIVANSLAQMPDYEFNGYEPNSTEEKIGNLLDWYFADVLATQLLGRGYGTGEGSMNGEFVADLQSGQISDQE